MSATAAPQPPIETPGPRPSILRQPVPLNVKQEGEIRELYYKRVRGFCAAELKAFAECAAAHSFSAGWKCRSQRELMNSCMVSKATPEQMDRAREEWFRMEIRRREEKAEQERLAEERRLESMRRKREGL